MAKKLEKLRCSLSGHAHSAFKGPHGLIECDTCQVYEIKKDDCIEVWMWYLGVESSRRLMKTVPKKSN